MKWIFRIVVHLFKFLFIKIPMQIIGLIVLAPLLLFCSRTQEHLPRMFKWFDNAQYYIKPLGSQIDGLSGDPGMRAQWKDPTGWLARYYWLAIRNPINYFQYFVLGKPFKPIDIDGINVYGNRYVSDWVRDKDIPNNGIFVAEVVLSGKTYWEIYIVINHISDRCLRVRLGYKINQKPEETVDQQLLENNHLQFTFNFHPWTEIQDRSR